jgi:hypothetical protein
VKAIIDIETDSLNPSVIHCASVKQIGVEGVRTFTSPSELGGYLKCFDTIIAHNGINFDFPILARLWDIHLPFNKMVDTLILSMMEDPTREGGHSLRSWGERVGFDKMEYFGDFSEMNEELSKYCERDVLLCERVYTTLVNAMRLWHYIII